MVGSLQAYAERSDAQAEAEKMASERDTQWDDRQAIVFLASHSLEFPGTSSDDLYFMSFVDYTYGLGDSYSIASIRNQLWLPEARTGGSDGGGAAARTPRQRRFLTGVPQQTPDTSPRAATVSTRTETPSITLTDFQATVSRIEAELAGQSEGYRFCVQENYERLQKVALWASRGDTFMSPKTFTVEIDSGQKAGTEIIYDTLKPGFPILGVFRLKGQSKRDGSIIVRSCKASLSPVYPIRDAIPAVNHASCPSLSSSGPPPMG